MRWQAIRLLLLIFLSSVVAGVSLLTLIPLLNLADVGLKNDSVNAVSKYFESFFFVAYQTCSHHKMLCTSERIVVENVCQKKLATTLFLQKLDRML